MPPKQKKDCLIILVNVGGTDETKGEEGASFLEKSKLVMKHLIQREIFLRPKDEVGVIVMGASEAKNKLGYDNIVEMNTLQMPTWNLVNDIINLQGTEKSVTWVDAMTVLLDYVNRECVEHNAVRKVILLTDFKEDANIIEQYDKDTIVADIKAADVNILAIGDKALVGDSQIDLNPSEQLFADVCRMVEGQTLTFGDTIPKLMIYRNPSKTAMPWKVDMDLFGIEIPVVVYLKTTEDFKLPVWHHVTETNTGTVPVSRNRALVDKDKNEISRDEIVTGHMYGRKFIAFSDEDKAALKYESGPKGFTIFGFTKRKFITLGCLAGQGSYIVIPAQQWASPFYSLVKAMVDTKKVAIVRRVYRANVTPKMGVLFPKIDIPGQPWCLVYTELIYAEDRRIVQVKALKSTMNALSEEQDEALNDLIDSMMLPEVEDDSINETNEAFDSGTVCDISRQLVWDRLTHRALNPTAPIPPISDFLRKFLEPSESVKSRSKPVLKVIKSLFPIKPVEKKKSTRNYRRGHNESLEIEENFEGVAPLTQSKYVVGEKSTTEKVATNIDSEEEQMSQLAESIEAASEVMDVDLDELAMSM